MEDFRLTANEKSRQKTELRFYKDKNTRIQNQEGKQMINKPHHKKSQNTNRRA